jgi:hypothetical protein
MSAFQSARMVEVESMTILRPYLKEKTDGQLVWNDKGPLAMALQETVGDMLFTNKQGFLRSVEVKAESRYTGNLFLETWSNRNLSNRHSHAERGSNPGWMFKLKADLLLYHFLDRDELHTLDFFALKQWAFSEGNLWRYEEKPQSRRDQLNDTWGRCVPIADLNDAGIILNTAKPLALQNKQLAEAF